MCGAARPRRRPRRRPGRPVAARARARAATPDRGWARTQGTARARARIHRRHHPGRRGVARGRVARVSGSRRVVAAAYGGPENLRLQEVPLPSPGSGQVLVSVRAAGVNAYDAKVYASPGDPEKLPMALGYEASGVVTVVGDAVSGWSAGDEVIAFRASGAYASDLVVDTHALTAKPPSLGWPEAAAMMLTGAAGFHTME